MTTRVPLLAANWKMNTTLLEGIELCRDLVERLGAIRDCEVAICPPFTHLSAARECLAGSRLRLGAQNMYWEPKGAYTGEVSPQMLSSLVDYVIVGHSERRSYFGETDADVNRKLRAAFAAGLAPIFCAGETGDERAAGQMKAVLTRQVREGLAGIEVLPSLVVAYEPVWAIGTGVAAHGEQAQEAIALIRSLVRSAAGTVADSARILYGGSVTPENISEFMAEPDVDGGLVGGASLSAEAFARIVDVSVRARAGGR